MKLISVNIEEDKHLDLLKVFLEAEQPDVLCVQEVIQNDLDFFSDLTGYTYTFAPMFRKEKTGDMKGIAVFAKDISSATIHLIGGNQCADLLVPGPGTLAEQYDNITYQLLVAHIHFSGHSYVVGTTHFPVTENGLPAAFQDETVTGLLSVLEDYKEIVFCGDFNAPRGGPAFTRIANVYTDHIPARYSTSIDGSLHRAGPLPYMVDGLFSTPGYECVNVELRSGVSDHLAIVSTVQKV